MKCSKCGKEIDINKDFYVYIAKTKEAYCKSCYNLKEIYEVINK